ncbi:MULTISPECIES: YveK family protein [unclassified Rhodococcus (in: high G+C Gram-positive bacteria)]|uniref:YveK family protein n=1 Tax=unclassified Rhodococcus (in: high G+C Gram-positive bacteria) TaxID=192944 RepID=UPI0015955B02|nr:MULTISPECIES: Wzz/FepE/Etk N-terminal domain-containing protein [unclassified Rhodococcus (in: high G+C Gram-positive bacteria)]
MGTIIGAGWRIVAVCVVVSVSAAFGISLLVTPVYESRAQMFVSTSGAKYSPDVYEGNLYSQQAIPAYAGLVTNEVVASAVIADLALDLTPAELADKVTMTYSPETVVFDIVATDSSPELAADIANTMATELSAVIADLEAPEDGGAPAAVVGIRNQPEIPSAPIRPNTPTYLMGGAAVGLVIGTVLVLVRHRSRGTAQ